MTHPVSNEADERIASNDNSEQQTQNNNSHNSHESATETKSMEDTEQDSEDSNEENSSEDPSKSQRHQPGQELSFIRVRFPGNSKSFPFLLGKRNFRYGQTVVAMSDRGMAVGYINSFPYIKKYTADMGQVRTIAKFASREDMEKEQDLIDQEKRAEELCLRLIERYKLEMTLTHVQYIQFGKKAVFYFTAPARVDFRDLVKDLVGDLKMRIELRQISVRDRAAAIGAIGACGLQTCCSSFLQRYGQVSMKMAKNQNLALVPSKINGVCGQVKCCIKYEDDVYGEKRKLLPTEGAILEAANGDIGRVYRLHLIIEQFEMMTINGQRRRYARNMFDNGEVLKGYDFPQTFSHVVDETSQVLGFETEEEKHEMQMQKFEDEGEGFPSKSTASAFARQPMESTQEPSHRNNQKNANESDKPKRANNRNRNRKRNNNKRTNENKTSKQANSTND